MKKIILIVCALVMGTGLSCATAGSRNYIAIVGSSTVYPFATVVAEQFGKTTRFRTPKIEATGSGGGMKLFCEGLGVQHPDITNSSRRIKKSEYDMCRANGVREITEVKIGYDGIVIANSRKAPLMNLTRRDIFLALAREVPAPDGSRKLVSNPYRTWKDVNSKLPATPIKVLGPPPTSGTRDAFVELAMEGGCKTFDWIKAMKKDDMDRFKRVCHTVREDGAYVEAGENDNLIVQKLIASPDAAGIFGYSFLEENQDTIQGSLVEGVAPEFESIADGSYPVSRPLFFYVKKAHVKMIPGMMEYVKEFTSEKAWGEDGYLADRGLIPMPDDERAKFRHDALELVDLKL
jgi:phosphate transport system substrate-binding protein